MTPMRRALLLALTALTLAGCRVLFGEVACRRDRDCPEGVPRCEGALDGGVGTCVEAGLDAGPVDASAPSDGGPRVRG